jgi:hypothetical protein
MQLVFYYVTRWGRDSVVGNRIPVEAKFSIAVLEATQPPVQWV